MIPAERPDAVGAQTVAAGRNDRGRAQPRRSIHSGTGLCGGPTRPSGVVITRSRTSSEVANAVAALPSAGLAEVTEQAALQVRIDRKYMVPVERFAELIVRLPQGYAVLEVDGLRGFAYESVYFDTPDLLTYRQHLQGRRRRYKVRTRAYLDTADCVFEVKLKGSRDRTVKAQLPYSLADRTHITPPARAFLVDRLEKAYGQLAPRLAARVTTLYRRTTLVDLDRGTRLTCDVDLTYIGNGRRAVGPSSVRTCREQGRSAPPRR